MSDEKIKVFDLANELNVKSLELVEKLNAIGINVKSHMSAITVEEAELFKSKLKPKKERSSTTIEESDDPLKKKMIVRRRTKKAEEPIVDVSSEATEEVKVFEQTTEVSVDLVVIAEKEKNEPETEEERKNRFLKKAKEEEDALFESKKKEARKKVSKKENKREVVNIKEIKKVVTGRATYGQKKRPQAGKQQKKTLITTMKESKRKIRLSCENILVADLAKEMGVRSSDIIKKLFEYGIMVTQNQVINFETAKTVANDFSYAIEFVGFDESKIITEIKDEEKDLTPRAPVVTMMGHVDHGKTSILDAIRETRVVDKEAGGITQHTGAYEVTTPRGPITFIDTPGHEAFSEMRARGSQITDIVVLVVAADDGVMPQTKESIAHAKSAGVEVVVAVNKIDKVEANFERIKQQLADLELLCEEWGGQTILVPTSATKKIGIDKLLDAIILQAEVMELRANQNREPEGIVIEARLDKGMGPVSTVIVQNGTLKVGEYMVAGTSHGRIRSIKDSYGKSILSLNPSQPGEVLGLNAVPEAGDKFFAVKNESDAKKLICFRIDEQRKNSQSMNNTPRTLEDFMNKASSDSKELNLLVKADTKGTAEAVNSSLLNLSDAEVKINVVYVGIGGININDINLAVATNSIIIAFNVRPDTNAFKESQKYKLDIRNYDIIYKCIEDIEKAKRRILDPIEKEQINGHAEVRQIFSVPKVGVIAGCGVSDGKILRNSSIRVTRDGVIVHTCKIKSLKHFKDDAKEVVNGNECGIVLEGFNDVKVGDFFESFSVSYIEHADKK